MLLILAGLPWILQPTSAADGDFVNLSTRALVGTGAEVMIGGFIIEDGPRRILIQARGPELANDGISNALADPVLTVIRQSDGMELVVNDDWGDSQGQLVTELWGGSPNLMVGSLSSAAVLTLDPGRYTARVDGKNGTGGVAMVEVYGIDSAGADGKFVNLSTRALVGTGAEVMIGGFIIEDGPRRVLIQARGPELANDGISNALADPVLTLIRLSDGMELMTNDDWEDSQEEVVRGIWGDHINLNDGSASSALVTTLDPGRYTAKVDGKTRTTGVALVEVYGIEPDTQPSFAAGSGPDDHSYPVDTAISALTLPEASGGNGPLTYSLSPSVPGLSFDATTRRLSGTPITPGTHMMTYTVTDFDGDSVSLTFRIYSPDLESPDRAALTAVYNATDGANWTNSDNWVTDLPLDQWYGVTVDNNGRVIELSLSENQLNGPIPAELGGLAYLETLRLSDNQLSGPIPPELGYIEKLESLDLTGNQLSGSIPAGLGNLSNLEYLYLGDNQFAGCIPDGLRDVAGSDLSTLGLQYCETIDRAALVALYNATDGPNWTNSDYWLSDEPLDRWYGVTVDGNGRVIGLILNANELSGPIPAELGNLEKLENLYLGGNQFVGCIPDGLREVANNDLSTLSLLNCVGEGQETTYGIGDTLSDLPTGSWTPDETSGGSFLLSGGNVTIQFDNGGYIEEDDFRYTCQSSGGCVIENRGVTSGMVVQTASSTAPGAREPWNGVGTSYETGDKIVDLPTDLHLWLEIGQIWHGEGYRYTCRTSSGCRMRNQVVLSGSIIQTSLESIALEDEFPDSRLLHIYNDNVVVMQVDEDVGHVGILDSLEAYSKDFYGWFEDEFDYLFFLSNLSTYEETLGFPYAGIYNSVMNDTGGLGISKYFNSGYGSAGRLRGVIHMTRNTSLRNGPSLHELLHAWANYAVPTSAWGHWGFSSANGQIGGFNLEKLVDHGGGQWSAGLFGEIGNGHRGEPVPYSPIDLYFAGLVPPEEVPDLWVAEDGKWLVDENGVRVTDENGDRIFTANNVRTITIDEIIAQHGERNPPMVERLHQRAAVILLVDADHPPSEAVLESASRHASWLGMQGHDGSPRENNYYGATGGKATITLGGLAELRKSTAFAPTNLPASYGVPPPPHATTHDGSCHPFFPPRVTESLPGLLDSKGAQSAIFDH